MATAQGVIARRVLDFKIARDMCGPTFLAEAYRSADDRDQRRRAVVSEDEAGNASSYRFAFKIPTLVARDVFAPMTEIGVDTDVADYPLKEPRTSILSSHVPWSPHFMRGAPVCIGGEFWLPRRGHVTIGHLALHLARLLNWDEKGRGPGYVGWNGEAVNYQREKYHGRPLDPNVVYPILPSWLGGGDSAGMAFDVLNAPARSSVLSFERIS